MSYTPSYPIPSLKDESYILMTLSIGTAKRFLNSLNTLGWFEEKDQDEILDLGVELLEGKTSSENYLKGFVKLLKKYTDEKLPSLGEQQILSRLNISTGSKVKGEKSLDKESKKSVTKKGTLKEGREEDWQRWYDSTIVPAKNEIHINLLKLKRKIEDLNTELIDKKNYTEDILAINSKLKEIL